MAEAALRVRIEGGSEVKRALNATQGAAREAAQAQNAEARRAAKERERIERDAAKASAKAAQDAAKARVKAAKEAERAEVAAVRASAKAAQDAARAEAAKSKAAEREAAKRQRTADSEARAAKRAADKSAKDFERAERQKTNAAERESRRRDAAAQREGRQRSRAAERRSERRWGTAADVARGGIRAAGALAGDLTGQAQDARMRRATSERSLGSALYQTGADETEVARRMDTIRQFSADRGIAFQDVTSALAAAQGQFSVLSPDDAEKDRERARLGRDLTPQDLERLRGQRLRGALDTIAESRNTGSDPSQMLRLSGMLAQSGFDQDMQRQMRRYTTAAAMAGSVEAGNLTQEGLSSIMGRMSQSSSSLGASATPQQRQRAMAESFRQSVAEMEVQASFGNSPRRAGEALRNLGGALESTTSQDKILTNIRSRRAATGDVAERARLQRLEETLFEADPTRRGQHRLRQGSRNPLQFAEQFFSVMGNDPTAMGNLFAGGGHGNARSMQANWRQMLSAMGNTDANGKTGAERVRAIMNARLNTDESDPNNDLARGRRLFENDSLSQVTREQERRDNALTSNTSEISRLNKELQEFRTNNPVLSAITGLLPGGDAAEALAARASREVNGLGGSQGAGGIVSELSREVTGNPTAIGAGIQTVGNMLGGIFGGGATGAGAAAAQGQPTQLVIQHASINVQGSQQAGAFNRANAATGPAPTPPEHRSRG